MLPHVFLTSEIEWDPSVSDHTTPEDEAWGVAPGDNVDSWVSTSSFDVFGQYCQCVTIQYAGYFASCYNTNSIEDVIDQCVFHVQHPWDDDPITKYAVNEHGTVDMVINNDVASNAAVVLAKAISKRPPDYLAVCPFLVDCHPKLSRRQLKIPHSMLVIPVVQR
jgi:hypothetical protein